MEGSSGSSSGGSGTCSVEVALRIRPIAQHELVDGCEKAVVALDSSTIMVGADKQFTYNFAFGDGSSQATVFDACVLPLVMECLKGYNATVFAYGQTVRNRARREARQCHGDLAC
jgi:hypothetical protein